MRAREKKRDCHSDSRYLSIFSDGNREDSIDLEWTIRIKIFTKDKANSKVVFSCLQQVLRWGFLFAADTEV